MRSLKNIISFENFGKSDILVAHRSWSLTHRFFVVGFKLLEHNKKIDEGNSISDGLWSDFPNILEILIYSFALHHINPIEAAICFIKQIELHLTY